MAGTLKDIVKEGAAPSEAFGFGRSSGFKARENPRSPGDTTTRDDGPIQKLPPGRPA